MFEGLKALLFGSSNDEETETVRLDEEQEEDNTVCPVCGDEFETARGRAIHEGQVH